MKTNETNTVRSSKRLAEILSVTPRTICNWRRLGLLDEAMVVDTGRVLIYDLQKVYEALNRKGRRAQLETLKRNLKL